MKFLELAKKRYSSRKYKKKEVEKDKLLQILEAGRVAPSARNQQPWHFVVVRNKEVLSEIKKCYTREWIQNVPAIIVACGDHRSSWRRADGKDHCDIDISIAIDHMTLAATELELATCWICKFDVMRCAAILELPEGIEPIALLPVGYPDDKTKPDRHDKKRKALKEIVRWDKF